jgi:predicted ATPase
VTLTGSGGAGKTRRAVEVARQLVDDGTTEARLVDLAPLTNPALVGEAVAGAQDEARTRTYQTAAQLLLGS